MKIRVHETAELPWVRIGDRTRHSDVLNEAELNSHIRFHENGTEKDLQLMEVKYLPDTEIEPHWHETPEIIYVVEGELHFGAKVLRPGSSIFVDRDAVYAFRAGPKGLTMLNFRPTADDSMHMKKKHARAS